MCDLFLVAAAYLSVLQMAVPAAGAVRDDPQPVVCLHGDHAVTALSFSDDGEFLLSGGAEGTLKVWNGKTYHLKTTINGHKNQITDVAGLNGMTALSASLDGTLRKWDLRNGRSLQYSINPFTKQLAIDREKHAVYVPQFDVETETTTIHEIDIATLERRRTFPLIDGGTTCIAICTRNGKQILISGNLDTQLREFFLQSDTPKRKTYSGNDMLNDDLLQLVSLGNDCLLVVMRRAIRILNMKNNTHADLTLPECRFLSAAVWPKRGIVLASIETVDNNQNDVHEICAIDLGTKQKTHTLYSGKQAAFRLAVNPMSSVVAAGLSNGEIRIWVAPK